MKEGIINLTEKKLDGNKKQVLNLSVKFVATYSGQRPYMNIIQATEICALKLVYDGYFKKAERLWQGVSKILLKDVNKKHRHNLTIEERKAIREIKIDANLKVYSFAEGFVIMEEVKQIEKQIRKLNIIANDPTTTLLNRSQKELAKLKKEGKFDRKTYYTIGCNTIPSNPSDVNTIR